MILCKKKLKNIRVWNDKRVTILFLSELIWVIFFQINLGSLEKHFCRAPKAHLYNSLLFIAEVNTIGITFYSFSHNYDYRGRLSINKYVFSHNSLHNTDFMTFTIVHDLKTTTFCCLHHTGSFIWHFLHSKLAWYPTWYSTALAMWSTWIRVRIKEQESLVKAG